MSATQQVLENMARQAPEIVKQAPTTSASYAGVFASYGAADAYGVPQEIIESLVQPSGLLIRFDWTFDNRPVVPADIFATKEGSDDGSFAEGGCPTGSTASIGRLTYSAKSFGACSDKLTLPALASKQHTSPTPRRVRTATQVVTLNSEWEYQMFRVLQRLNRVREYLTINGNAAVNPNNYDGLLRIIRTNHLDINGNALSEADSVVHDEAGTEVTVRKLEEVIGALEDNYVDVNDIVMVMRPGMFRHLAYKISLNYMDPEAKKQELLGSWTLPLGGADIPVETTQFMPRTGSGQSWTTHILFLTFQYLGLPSLYFAFFDFSEVVTNYPDLYAAPASAGGLTPSPYVLFTKDRGSYCSSAEFCLMAHGHVIALAPQSLGKITNVSYSALRERTVTNP